MFDLDYKIKRKIENAKNIYNVFENLKKKGWKITIENLENDEKKATVYNSPNRVIVFFKDGNPNLLGGFCQEINLILY